MKLKPGDLLLVRLQGREGIPATPDGKVYSDTRIKLKNGENPVWEHMSSGETFPVKMVHNGELVGQWFKLTPTKYHIIHKKWISILEERGIEFEPRFEKTLENTQDEIQSLESLNNVQDSLSPSETTESQDQSQSTVVEEENEWSKVKSEVMGDLPNL